MHSRHSWEHQYHKHSIISRRNYAPTSIFYIRGKSYMSIKKKIVWLGYDFDTALGIKCWFQV